MMTIEKDGIRFEVEDGVLFKMIPTGSINTPIDAYIPHKLNNRTKINSLGTWFCKGLYGKITIDDEIECVQEKAFYCAKAETIVWSAKCLTIPEMCFYSCTAKSILNIDNVEEVGYMAFNNAAITEIKWPSCCTKVPECCFYWSCLERITNIDHVKKIDRSAFEGCRLEEFVVPAQVKTIPESMLQSNRLLKSIVLHDNITCIKHSAFNNTGIESIQWPSKCKRVPEYCFHNCENLVEIKLPDDIKSIGSGAFQGTKFTCFDWPSACKEIPAACFFESGITKISFSSDITAIGKDAFIYCKELTEIDLPDSVKTIGIRAFYKSGIKKLKWPASCISVPTECFAESELTEIQFHPNVCTIGQMAFRNCKNLMDIELPDSVRSIGNYAFKFARFTHFKWPASCDSIPVGCFNDSMIEDIVIPSHVTSIKGYSFTSCPNIKHIDLSALLVCDISKNAFRGVDRDKIAAPWYCGVA